jgi:hypothetical protein
VRRFLSLAVMETEAAWQGDAALRTLHTCGKLENSSALEVAFLSMLTLASAVIGTCLVVTLIRIQRTAFRAVDNTSESPPDVPEFFNVP